MRVVSSEKIPIKMWLDKIEDGALTQAKNLANLPFAFKHIAIMPDSHCGYGMPIGGVLAAKNVVIPNAVGVDIGCGMGAVKTNIKDISKENLELIIEKIKLSIPVGFSKHSRAQIFNYLPDNDGLEIVTREKDKALKQLKTLGGGNHFLEIQKGNNGFIWIMVHSGSRNLGKQVADHYGKIAKELNKLWYSNIANLDLAFLPCETKEAKNYIAEMNYCVEYAFVNRTMMMNEIKEIFTSLFSDVGFESAINIAHNYARLENHFGKNVMVHRKGATSAREGEMGIIPGSQGTKSYIVKGLGNKNSFMSCSHGAGRKMSRTKAKKELDLQKEIEILDKIGVIHGVKTVDDLDEAPGSYKDIDEVMNNQKDLVSIEVELTPLAVIKG